jgi:hypothetical protein
VGSILKRHLKEYLKLSAAWDMKTSPEILA